MIGIHDGPLAGQEINHVHVHVIPRTEGDGGRSLLACWPNSPSIGSVQPDFKGLELPVLLNPMRAETVRDEDEEFQQLFKAWKANELDDETFRTFREKIREKIVVQDLYMLKICDTNLINFDGTAGAGTFGEAQISALKNSQVIIWLTNGMKISNISPWMMPSITKILVGDELWPFLENFK